MRSARLPLVRKHELTDYRKNQARSILFLLLLTLLLLVSVLLSLRAGSYNTPVTELIKGIFGRSADKKINLVIRNNRMPRICTAIVAGAGLGLSGCILQAILHNPLASASTLGVSQGATFGAAFAIVTLNLTGGIGISLWSFLGSIAVAVVILGLSRLKQVSAEGIVLAGVAISSMLGGATTLIQYFANEIQLANLVFWTFGDLGSSLILLLGSFCFGYFLLEHIQDLIRTFGQADGAQAEDLIHLILQMRGKPGKTGVQLFRILHLRDDQHDGITGYGNCLYHQRNIFCLKSKFRKCLLHHITEQ